MTPMARNICTLLPPLLLILAFKPILVYTIVTEEHYILCSMKELFFKTKKIRARLFEVKWCGK